MDINPARRNQKAGGINLAASLALNDTNSGNGLPVNCHVRHPPRRPSAVNHRSPTNDQIVHHDFIPFSFGAAQ
jgi:hypothetical protein